MELVITLLLAGFILIILETLLPGMIAGIAGLLCVMGGVAVAYNRVGTEAGHWTLVLSLALLSVSLFAYLKYFPDSRFARMFISTGTIGEGAAEQPSLVGRTGIAETILRPSGMAVIDGRRIDVVTDGQLIEKGERVMVIAVEGMRVVVSRPTNAPET